MAPDRPDFDVSDLSLLVSSPRLTNRERQAGQRILHRLSSPVRVAVQGLERRTTQAVVSHLRARPTAGCIIEFADDGTFDDADIVLWCTQAFTDAERETWAAVPDSVKDHSFLIACCPPPDQLPHLREVALEEFIAFHHLPTLGAAGDLNAMTAKITHQIENGMQEVRDGADLYVQKHRAKMPVAPQPPAAPAPLGSAELLREAAQPGGWTDVFETALARFSDHAAALSDLSTAAHDDIGQQVLRLCTAASEDLVDVFTTGNSNHPDYPTICDMMFEASDKIVLMSLEDDVCAAADAVAILVQIRKDISVCTAV